MAETGLLSLPREKPRTWQILSAWALAACVGLLASGCGTGPRSPVGGTGPTGNTVPITLAVTDNPPAGVTILGFEVTITGASLTNQSGSSATLIPSTNPVTLELKRLEGDSTLIANTNVPIGTYSNLTVSIANPSVTFANNSGSTITVGSVNCANGATCQVQLPAASNVVITTGPFPLTVSAGTIESLILDFNMTSLLSPTFGVNFAAGMSVGGGATTAADVVTSVEDQVGQVTAIDSAHNDFTFVTSQATYKVNVDLNTEFMDFLSAGCSSANIGCLAVNQVVAVNMNLMGDGSLDATGVTFEDTGLEEMLTEGIIFSVDSSTQFRMAVLDTLPTSQSIGPGTIATVTMSGITNFSVDDEGPSTTAFSFIGPGNLVVGQEVQVKELSTSVGAAIQADRVRLRASRWTATVGSITSPNFVLNGLPALFTSKGFNQIQVQTTLSVTEFAGTTQSFSNLSTGMNVTARGQIFLSNGGLVMPASKITGR
jgi:hypothetical protein